MPTGSAEGEFPSGGACSCQIVYFYVNKLRTATSSRTQPRMLRQMFAQTSQYFSSALLFLGVGLLMANPAFGAITPYQPGSNEVSLKDMIPSPDARRNGGEFYNEQYSVSMKLKDGASSYLQLVISNLGAGDGKLAVVWELGLKDGTKVDTRFTMDRKEWTTAKNRFDVQAGKNSWSGKKW